MRYARRYSNYGRRYGGGYRGRSYGPSRRRSYGGYRGRRSGYGPRRYTRRYTIGGRRW